LLLLWLLFVVCKHKMFRVAIASLVLPLVFAERIQSHLGGVASKSKFGATCEELQEKFHNRVVNLQTFLDEHPEADFGTATQAHLYSRAFGVVRTLRRARECSWVIEGDSGDIAQVRAIVQTFLADNPCASAARAELDAGTLAETEEIQMQSVLRAMSIMNSEDCQVSDTEEGTIARVDEEEMNAQMDEAMAQAQDYADDLMDEGSGAFVQMDSQVRWDSRRFMRNLGVAFLFILLALACTGAVALIGGLIVYGWARATIRGPQAGFNWAVGALFGASVGGVVGLAACSYQLINGFLPRVAN